MAVAVIDSGIVRKFDDYPKVWGQSINITRTPLEWESYGFYPVQEPVISDYQSLIPLIPSDFDDINDVFVHRVYDFTQEEIDEKDQLLADTDSYANEARIEIQDGELFVWRIKSLIKRRVADNTITAVNGKGFRRNLRPIIPMIKEGEWDLAKEDLDAMTPGDSGVLSVLNEIRAMVDNYISNQ